MRFVRTPPNGPRQPIRPCPSHPSLLPARRGHRRCASGARLACPRDPAVTPRRYVRRITEYWALRCAAGKEKDRERETNAPEEPTATAPAGICHRVKPRAPQEVHSEHGRRKDEPFGVPRSWLAFWALLGKTPAFPALPRAAASVLQRLRARKPFRATARLAPAAAHAVQAGARRERRGDRSRRRGEALVGAAERCYGRDAQAGSAGEASEARAANGARRAAERQGCPWEVTGSREGGRSSRGQAQPRSSRDRGRIT